ncbi:MAG: bifunctional UDP-N-acetylglucosamine diphosphorylase/glucosamine-1-phosphate N-acetyltransferase GlmU [Alphaproteobacteria bacterium]
MSAGLAVVILAAGKGVRMKSARPKVLHAIGGRPMLAHVLVAAQSLGAERIVVVAGDGEDAIGALAKECGASVAIQDAPLGTGHAVMSADAALQHHSGNVLVLFGDAPLVTSATAKALVARLGHADIATLGFRPADPTGYGRMVTRGDALERIVEHKDASAEERRIGLCFSGPLAAKAETLFSLLKSVGNRNAQGEYYLTDVIAAARGQGLKCTFAEADAGEMIGVNSRSDLAKAEAAFQERRRRELMDAGVTFMDPSTVYLSADTEIEADVAIGPFVVFGPGVRVRKGAEIRSFCHIEGAEIGAGAIVGPFARLRPGTVLEANAHIGNFVEVKNSRVEEGAKANHLAYLGDARVGAGSNIGAGTITCNYDGVRKTKTNIGKGVFVGSNATLVAPLKLGDGAYVAAGSVVTEDVEGDALVFGRARQETKKGRAKELRARKGKGK